MVRLIKEHHFGFYPNESEYDAKQEAYDIWRRGDRYSYKDIIDLLDSEGHSVTYINRVLNYIDELDTNKF